MPDRFRTFALSPANTGANTLFTVPTANVAATPPVPVTTFMVKTIILHNDAGSGTVDAVLTYNDGSTDFEINNVAVAHQANSIINGTINAILKLKNNNSKLQKRIMDFRQFLLKNKPSPISKCYSVDPWRYNRPCHVSRSLSRFSILATISKFLMPHFGAISISLGDWLTNRSMVIDGRSNSKKSTASVI